MVLIAGDHHPGFSGFGDGDEYGWGTGAGRGEPDDLILSIYAEDPFHTPHEIGVSYNVSFDGDGRGYGPRGFRCPEYQFTTTRSFNGHLTNIFLRGLPS